MKKLKKYQIGGFPRLTPETIEYLKSLNNPKIGNYNIGVDEDIQAPLQAKLNTKKNKGLLNDSIISTEKEDWEKDYTSNKDNYQLKFDTSLIGVQNNGGDRRKYSAFIKDKYDIDVPTGNPQFADYMNVGKGLVYGATALTNELGEIKNKQYEKKQYIKSLQPTLFEDEFVQNTQPAYAKYGISKYPDGGKVPKLIITNNPKDPRLKAYNDSLSLYKRGEKDYAAYTKFIKDNNIKPNRTRNWDNPVTFEGNNYARIQPIEGRGFYYNHNPDVFSDTNIPSNSFPAATFRYKKPVQPIIYKKEEVRKPLVPGQTVATPISLDNFFTPPNTLENREINTSVAEQNPTNFSYTYRDESQPNKQTTKYLQSKEEWDVFIKNNPEFRTTENRGNNMYEALYNRKPNKYQVGDNSELEEMKTGGIPERYKKMGFTSVNSPKKTPSASKSHAVVVKDGSSYKLIRFGQQGVSGSPKKEGESESYKNRRESFKARHAANIAKGKTSAAYWANKVKWQDGGDVTATIEAEAGEVYEDVNNNIKKIPDNLDRHEDGGVIINDAQRVLEDTSTTRNDIISKALQVTPESMKAMFGVDISKALSHSEALESLNEKINSKTTKINNKLKKSLDTIDINKSDIYANNSLDLNSKMLNTIPSKEDIFNTLFNHQENIKSNFPMEQLHKAKYGITLPKYTGYFDKFGNPIKILPDDKGGGKTPTGRYNTEYDFTESELERYARQFGFRNDTAKSFQEDLYDYAVKNNPDLVKQMWTIYGNTEKGKNNKQNLYRDDISAPSTRDNFADNNPKARTMFLLGNILKNRKPEETVSIRKELPEPKTPDILQDKSLKFHEDNTDITSFNINKNNKTSTFNESLGFTDIASPVLSYLSADRIPAKYNPAEFNKVRLKLQDPTPQLEQGKRDFNATLNMLDNSGAAMANATNTFAQKYNIDNQILGNYENINTGIRNQEELYNTQVEDKQSQSDQQSRAIFEQQQLLGIDAQRKQKLTAIDQLFQRINENKALNRNGNLLLKLSPQFDQYGEYNNNDRNFTNFAANVGINSSNNYQGRYVPYLTTDGQGNQVPMVIDRVTGKPVSKNVNQSKQR